MVRGRGRADRDGPRRRPARRAASSGCAAASRAPTRSSSATRTSRCTSSPGRLPDLQPRQPDRAAPRSRSTRWASPASRRAALALRARRARLDLAATWTSTCSSSAPPARRPPPAAACPPLLVRRGGDRLLFDCGEGTQRQLLRSVGLRRPRGGVPHPLPRRPLARPARACSRRSTCAAASGRSPIYGPPGLRELFEALEPVVGRTALRARARSSSSRARSCERDGYAIAAFRVDHRVPRARLRARARTSARALRRARPSGSGVTPGPDFGRLQRGETVGGGARPSRCWGEPAPGRKLVLTGDTAPCEMTGAVARTAPTCSSTRRPSPRRRASAPRETGHTTAAPGGGARPRGRGAAARADPRVHPLRGRRDPRRGARGVRATRSSRATSTGRDAVPGARRAGHVRRAARPGGAAGASGDRFTSRRRDKALPRPRRGRSRPQAAELFRAEKRRPRRPSSRSRRGSRLAATGLAPAGRSPEAGGGLEAIPVAPWAARVALSCGGPQDLGRVPIASPRAPGGRRALGAVRWSAARRRGRTHGGAEVAGRERVAPTPTGTRSRCAVKR